MPRLISLTSLGAPAVPVKFRGQEELSRCFEFSVEVLSERSDLSPQRLLGTPMTVTLTSGDQRTRHFNGYCVRVQRGGTKGRHARYLLTLRPGLWFLTRNADCRVFQDMTVPDIVKSVITSTGRQQVDLRLSASYAPWKYCVQYRETDFNFVNRLLEQEGIYYHFEHSATGHTMVLCDSNSAHKSLPQPTLAFRPHGRALETLRDHLRTWQHADEYPFRQYLLNEYDYRDPNRDLLVSRLRTTDGPSDKFEVYDYPGEYDAVGEGEQYVGARIEEMLVEAETVEASGPAFDAAPALRFKLAEHPTAAFNGEYLITAAAYECSEPLPESGPDSGAMFDANLSAIRSQRQFRAPRVTPKPIVQGVQTATVVGPAGEEIYTDPEGLGRVKVQFHWDRYGARDENSSCWVRVATPWANQNFGFVAIPRVGSEVVVSFEEGDPDRPLIVGSVYNGSNKPTYVVPDNKTQSGLKTKSTKGGGAQNFNELRFEDKIDSELVFLQAEKDHHELVKNDGIYQIRRDSHSTVERNAYLTVSQKLHEKIGSDRLIDCGGSVHQNAAQDIMSKAGMRCSAEAGQEIHLKAGMTAVVEAGVNVTLKVGGNFISLTPAGIIIQGTMVMINSGGAAGSGSGVSVRAPEKALLPKMGEAIKSVAPRPARPIKPDRMSPTAITMQNASQNAMPFTPCNCC